MLRSYDGISPCFLHFVPLLHKSSSFYSMSSLSFYCSFFHHLLFASFYSIFFLLSFVLLSLFSSHFHSSSAFPSFHILFLCLLDLLSILYFTTSHFPFSSPFINPLFIKNIRIKQFKESYIPHIPKFFA